MLGDFSAGYLTTSCLIYPASRCSIFHKTNHYEGWRPLIRAKLAWAGPFHPFTLLPGSMAQISSASALCTVEGHQILSTDKFKLPDLAPKHHLDLPFCVPAWWCTGETAHGGEGWISERWKQPESPRAQEEVGPEMWNKELPVLLLSFYGGEKGCPGAKLWRPCSGFTLYLLTLSSNWKSK